MKAELCQLYPSIKASNVHVTGTPQFDLYYQPDLVWSYETFCKRHGFDTNKKAICFAGNEPNFPANHLYLKDALEVIQKNKLLSDVVVLVRPSPIDFSGKMESVAAAFPGLAIVAKPLWEKLGNRDWESFIPTPDDSIELLNLVHHCHGLVNMGSTMTLDFAHGNKPAINIAYNHPQCAEFDFEQGYHQQHLKTMDGLDATVLANSPAALDKAIEDMVLRPGQIATERLLWKKIITDDIHPAAANIAAFINKQLISK
jgi:hypothetical protein